jgi:hypothetical protein
MITVIIPAYVVGHWWEQRHSCIEAKSVLAMHQAGSQDPSGILENPNKPDI